MSRKNREIEQYEVDTGTLDIAKEIQNLSKFEGEPLNVTREALKKLNSLHAFTLFSILANTLQNGGNVSPQLLKEVREYLAQNKVTLEPGEDLVEEAKKIKDAISVPKEYLKDD